MQRSIVLLLLSLGCVSALAGERLEARRKGLHVICHRGAAEFAHENTLEAYRAALELGADGNEIDIRATKDGVLVCFHDDMLDRILHAYGDVADYTWDELQRFTFRSPGPFGDQCRIPTLEEVFQLHRAHDGLLHLDIKRPELDRAIAALLDKMEMWEHVAYCQMDHGGVILADRRLMLCHYKGQLYQDHGEVFPEAIATLLEKPGEGIIVDDPRGVLLALGRKLGRVSKTPVAAKARNTQDKPARAEAELVAILRDDADWDRVAESELEQAASGERIRRRAIAADELLALGATSSEARAALADRVQRRSLHKQWMYHGLDGEKSLRALLLMKAPQGVESARWVLWRDDPALAPVVNPQFKNPRSWTDFRVKTAVFPALSRFSGEESEELCRDYLALSDEEAVGLGPPQFEQAGRALLAMRPDAETASQLMKHRLRIVRGRAILDCLSRSKEAWAREALERQAPHALAYVVSD